ncbi:MAG TPA: YajQ family cyclic di-GMP-binding protein [Fibrobacteria bacterium]|nr:YajQ family cyclic di-GMP-binding protein [Fibrobacteria bacterium]
MPSESSFDIVCKTDPEELRNAVQHTQKELSIRFDFKGSKASIELDAKSNKVTLVADDEFKLGQLREMFEGKLVKRGLSPKTVKYSEPQAGGKMTVNQTASFQSGIAQEDAKKIVKIIKDAKIKVSVAIQGEQVRVSGKSRDDLQEAIAAVRRADLDFDCQFTNYR